MDDRKSCPIYAKRCELDISISMWVGVAGTRVPFKCHHLISSASFRQQTPDEPDHCHNRAKSEETSSVATQALRGLVLLAERPRQSVVNTK